VVLINPVNRQTDRRRHRWKHNLLGGGNYRSTWEVLRRAADGLDWQASSRTAVDLAKAAKTAHSRINE